jgi:broad specificity phosphatase PhoE
MGIPDTPFRRVDEAIELQIPGWRGKRQDEVYTPDVSLLRVTKGKWFVPPDGESERMVERRFSNWIEDEVTNNPDFVKLGRQTIAIVSHGLALKCLFHYILGYNDRFIRQFVIDNTAISRFRFTATGWFLVSINDASHTWEIGDVNREHAANITP